MPAPDYYLTPLIYYRGTTGWFQIDSYRLKSAIRAMKSYERDTDDIVRLSTPVNMGTIDKYLRRKRINPGFLDRVRVGKICVFDEDTGSYRVLSAEVYLENGCRLPKKSKQPERV